MYNRYIVYKYLLAYLNVTPDLTLLNCRFCIFCKCYPKQTVLVVLRVL